MKSTMQWTAPDWVPSFGYDLQERLLLWPQLHHQTFTPHRDRDLDGCTYGCFGSCHRCVRGPWLEPNILLTVVDDNRDILRHCHRVILLNHRCSFQNTIDITSRVCNHYYHYYLPSVTKFLSAKNPMLTLFLYYNYLYIISKQSSKLIKIEINAHSFWNGYLIVRILHHETLSLKNGERWRVQRTVPYCLLILYGLLISLLLFDHHNKLYKI